MGVPTCANGHLTNVNSKIQSLNGEFGVDFVQEKMSS